MYELGTEYESEGLVCKGEGWAWEWGGGGWGGGGDVSRLYAKSAPVYCHTRSQSTFLCVDPLKYVNG